MKTIARSALASALAAGSILALAGTAHADTHTVQCKNNYYCITTFYNENSRPVATTQFTSRGERAYADDSFEDGKGAVMHVSWPGHSVTLKAITGAHHGEHRNLSIPENTDVQLTSCQVDKDYVERNCGYASIKA